MCTECTGIEQSLCILHAQSWADAFRSSPSLVGVVHVYDDLRKRGLEFPMTDLDAMPPIHTPNRVRLPPKSPLLSYCLQRGCLSLNALTIFPAYRVFQKTEVQTYQLMLLAHSSHHHKRLPVFPVRTLHLQSSQVKDRPPFLHNRYTWQMYRKSEYGLIWLEFSYRSGLFQFE